MVELCGSQHGSEDPSAASPGLGAAGAAPIHTSAGDSAVWRDGNELAGN